MTVPEKRRFQLHPLHVPELLGPIPIPPEGLSLGRSEDADVRLSASFHGVSSLHARVFLRDGRVWVSDLSSKNGTLVGDAAIVERRLEPGEVFQLGVDGPRFSVLGPAGLEETVEFPRPDLSKRQRSLGPETVELVKEKLGIPHKGGVDQLVRRRTRRLARVFGVTIALLLAVGAGAFWLLGQRHGEALAQTEEHVAELDQRLFEARTEVARQREAWLEQERALTDARGAWEAHRAELVLEREQLLTSIRILEEGERSAGGELAELRERLAETSTTLAGMDPINLEQTKLDEVSRVERAVVFIEATLGYKEAETGRPLYFDRLDSGAVLANFDFQGTVYQRDGSGSGFCISPEGWILTNAHVVHKKDADAPLEFVEGVELEDALELSVVFSGESRRHPASLVRWVGDDSDDLALLKVEPFEGMPSLDSPDLAREPPPRGTEVFLIGFPLGKRALQEGETMIASTFRGIVSRSVDDYLQVDAAVHPGASGGPLIDGSGQVLGVVVGMQATPDSGGANQIGYIIPVSRVTGVWPPPDWPE